MAVLCFFFQTVYAQDKQGFDITYMIKFLKDTASTEFLEERARLLIHGENSLFITQKKEMIDSIRYFNLDGSRFFGVSQHGFIILKDFKKQDIVHYEQFLLNTGIYTLTERMDALDWQILPDTATIAGYPCQKAEVSFGNRIWYAWFTQRVPISDGPYKFCGLPGLIVNMNDATNTWFFTLVSLKQEKTQPIDLSYLPSPTQLAKVDFFKTRRQHKKNVVQINESTPSGVKFGMVGDTGNAKLMKKAEEGYKKDNNWIEKYD